MKRIMVMICYEVLPGVQSLPGLLPAPRKPALLRAPHRSRLGPAALAGASCCAVPCLPFPAAGSGHVGAINPVRYRYIEPLRSFGFGEGAPTHTPFWLGPPHRLRQNATWDNRCRCLCLGAYSLLRCHELDHLSWGVPSRALRGVSRMMC